MKTTLAMSWKALASKIHPPLPKTASETQKLMKVLQASFQKQLDQEHPEGSGSAARRANDHLQSVLASPLLSKMQPRSAEAKKQSTTTRQAPDGLQERMERPLEMFQKEIADGTVSLESATVYLGMTLRKCLRSTADSPSNMMVESGASSIFLHWLWSAGISEGGKQLLSKDFTAMMIQFLVAEQRYDVILQWILSVSAHRESLTITGQQQHELQAFFLLKLVKAETTYGAGFGGGLMHFIKCIKQHEGLKMRLRSFKSAGRYLCLELSNPSRTEGVSRWVLDDFVEKVDLWTFQDTFIPAWTHAFHHLHPSPDRAYVFLHRLSAAKIADFSAAERARLIQLSLRIAELLMKSERSQEASWVTNFIQQHFASDVGSIPTITHTSKASAVPNARSQAYETAPLLETLVPT